MMMNFFSEFDPTWYTLYCYNTTVAIPLISLLSTFWFNNKVTLMTLPPLSFIMLQLTKTKLKSMKSMSNTMSSMFILIIYMNLSGVLPYMFSTTSHIIITLSLGLPLWMLPLISSARHSMKKTLGHVLPNNTPLWLSPFLILIETTSTLIRPLTLTFRLAANMTAGHVVLKLISSFSASLKMKTFSTMTTMSSMYLSFELMVCMAQAYIFCLLVSLYMNDHP